MGRLNAYYSYNAIDAAADSLEAEKLDAEASPIAAPPAADDDDRGDDGPAVRLPPIGQLPGAGALATRPVTPETMIEGWHLR